jgi:hypothetical protein
MNYLIVISVAGKSAAVDRLIDGIDVLVQEATMEVAGIDGLTTEVIRGAGADAARERLRGDAEAPADLAALRGDAEAPGASSASWRPTAPPSTPPQAICAPPCW